MAYIRVLYRTKERDFDYIPGNLLDSMITLDEISHFYRPSEKRWISIKFDALRGAGGQGDYQGPERRNLGFETKERETQQRNEQDRNWLERLWRHIETS